MVVLCASACSINACACISIRISSCIYLEYTCVSAVACESTPIYETASYDMQLGLYEYCSHKDLVVDNPYECQWAHRSMGMYGSSMPVQVMSSQDAPGCYYDDRLYFNYQPATEVYQRTTNQYVCRKYVSTQGNYSNHLCMYYLFTCIYAQVIAACASTRTHLTHHV